MTTENQNIGAQPKLQSELARCCLPSSSRDPNRRLAWVNSIGLMFLAIGIFGARRAEISIAAPRPLVENFAVIAEPLPPPPVQRVEAMQDEQLDKPSESPAPQVVVVVPESPAINFAVPTVGNLVAPAALAQAPTGNELRAITPMLKSPSAINSTGTGGDRPQPPYPQMAKDLAQQGTVLLSMTVDANGLITSIEIKQSSGSAILDRSTLEFVKRHWILPAGEAGRIFEAPIHYVLSL